MIFLGILIIGFSCMATVWLSGKVADLHYKIRPSSSNEPLYLFYGAVFVIIWAAAVGQILNTLQ